MPDSVKKDRAQQREGAPRPIHKGRLAVAILIVWPLHFGIYLLFISNFQKYEMIVGIGAAAIGALPAILFAIAADIQFAPRFYDLLQGFRLPWCVVSDTWQIFKALCRQLFTAAGAPSFLAAVPYDTGGGDSRSAARRALVIGFTTVTPNSIFLGTFPRRSERKSSFQADPRATPPPPTTHDGLLLYHQLLPNKIAAMTKNLGAKPEPAQGGGNLS